MKQQQRASILLALAALLVPHHPLVRGVMGKEGGGGAVELTISNFEELVDGKSVFIKFYAPWCAHCRGMSDDWNKLADDFAGHPVALIGKVDCTSDEGQPICEDFDITGFPTLVYGDPMSAETYDGARDYESLSAWAKEHISKPICSLYKTDHCNAEQQKMIQSLQAKTDEELEGIIAQVESKVKEKEIEFDGKVTVIQKQYDQLVEDFNKNLDAIKEEFNYKFVEQLLGKRQQEQEQDEDSESGDEASGDEL